MTYFIYYGVIVPMSNVESLMVQCQEKDAYVFIMRNGLDYRRIGDYDISRKIIIGKELKFSKSENPYKLSMSVPFAKKIMYNMKLDRKEEQDTLTKLLKVGVYTMPYYCAACHWAEKEIK